jgi:O-antigen ligase
MPAPAVQPVQKKWADFVIFILTLFICVQPVIADQAPRFLTVTPGIAALGLFFAARISYGTWPKLSCTAFGWMLALGILLSASALWGINPGAAFERGYKTTALLLGGALLFSVTPYIDAEKFRKYFPWAMIVTAALLCIDLYFNRVLLEVFHAGNYSLNGKDNFALLNRPTVFFILSLFAALACLRGRFKSAEGLLLGLLTALLLYKTDSQSAQVAALGGIILYFLFPNKIKAAWIGLFAILAAGVLAMPWIVQVAFQQYGSIGAGEEGSLLYVTYAGARLEIWDFVANHIMQHPLLGFGADATKFILNDTARINFTADHILHPHNFVLQLWLELGVLGPLFALAFLGMLIKAIYEMEPEAQRPMIATLFATIAAAAASYGLWQGWWIGAFCLLFTYTLVATGNKKARE